jgi:hypothetical protein
MGLTGRAIETSLGALDAAVVAVKIRAGAIAPVIDRWHTDAAAAIFQLHERGDRPLLVCILGGTGTGKSTILNRLLQADLSAASFRRTFTAGAVAVANSAKSLPANWLGVPHEIALPAALPARGRVESLVVVENQNDLLKNITLVDTPDLDGDQPAHHAQADRAFRWAEGVLFLVSPEKYQMTELLPYYRLARRYATSAIFVMNKCETPEMLEDYRAMLSGEPVRETKTASSASAASNATVAVTSTSTSSETAASSASVANPTADSENSNRLKLFAVPRDDAAFEPPVESNLAALRAGLASLQPVAAQQRLAGNRVRVLDLLGRLRDQVIGPLRSDRREIDAAASSLRAMETPAPGVDVNPLTEQLERRLQQRSVLYLIGPGRILDRVRQAPGMLVRLPRTAWDLLVRGRLPAAPVNPDDVDRTVPNFRANLIDQFVIIQSRIDDALRSTPTGQKWISDAAGGYGSSKIDPAEAGNIADDEIAQLNAWLQRRWNATPRDTALLMKLLRYLPGGEKLTQWSEAAPYLLAIIVAAHHAFFGHIDLMILGGYSLATWLTERLSNEVAARTRQANRAIAFRFGRLAHDQIRKSIDWLQSRAPKISEIDLLEEKANELEEKLRADD